MRQLADAGTAPRYGPRPAERSDRIIIIGGGAVGALFAQALAPQAASIDIVDLHPSPTSPTVNTIQCDAADFSAAAVAALAKADLVIFALPEAAAEAAAPDVLAIMRPDALLVDTLSIKTGICGIYEAWAPSQEVLSINPMFAPSLGFAGHGAIVVPVARGPRADRFLDFLTASGCRLLHMSAAEHDRAAAGLQVMTHAAILGLGLGLSGLGHDIARLAPIMPPPHRAMLGLLARIATSAPETYRDIQAGNPYAATARTALSDAINAVSMAADNPDAFAGLMSRVTTFLGDAAAPLAAEAQAMLEKPANPVA